MEKLVRWGKFNFPKEKRLEKKTRFAGSAILSQGEHGEGTSGQYVGQVGNLASYMQGNQPSSFALCFLNFFCLSDFFSQFGCRACRGYVTKTRNKITKEPWGGSRMSPKKERIHQVPGESSSGFRKSKQGTNRGT